MRRPGTWPRWPAEDSGPGSSPALLSRGRPREAAGEVSVSGKSLGKGDGRQFGGRVVVWRLAMVLGRKEGPGHRMRR